MRTLLFLLVFLATVVEAGDGLTVDSLTYQQQAGSQSTVSEGQIAMPFVRGGDKGVAARINDALFQGQFNVTAPVQPDHYFTLPDGSGTEGMASQAFSVSRNDDRILTLVFDNEGCGAYCENYQVIYSFAVATGKKIVPEDVFTAAGIHALEQRLQKERQAAYRKMLVSLRKDLGEARKKQEANSVDTISDLEERIALNSDCAGEGGHTDRTPRIVEPVQGFAYDKFELAEKTFRLTRERCSNHAMRALDDVGDVTLELPYPELAPYLTDAGKRLLLEKSTTQTGATGKALPTAEVGGDEALLLFPAPQDDASGLVWTVGGDPVSAGDGWWILACEQECTLHPATVQVKQSTVTGTGEEKIPAQQLQWLPVPKGKVIAMFRQPGEKSQPIKAGALKTSLHAGMDSYPAGRADTLEISIPLPDQQSALLVPRVLSAGAEAIDRLELRIDGKRQALPGCQFAGADAVPDVQQMLRWAGDLDGDGKLDLMINHDSNGIDVALYLSTLAQPGELVGLAGSMRYEQSGSGD